MLKTKKDLRKMVNSRILFGEVSNEIKVVEFIVVDSGIYIKQYKAELERDNFNIKCTCEEFKFSPDKSITMSYDIENTDNSDIKGRFILNVKDSNMYLYSCQHRKKFDKTNNIVKHTIMTAKDNDVAIDQDKAIIGQVIFAGSNVPPIIRIKSIEENIDVNAFRDNMSTYISLDLNKTNDINVYSSLKSEIKCTSVDVSGFKAKTTDPKLTLENLYTSSSLSKEKVEYDDSGSLALKYSNSLNKIKMSTDISDNNKSIVQKTYFNDILVRCVDSQNGNIKVYSPLENLIDFIPNEAKDNKLINYKDGMVMRTTLYNLNNIVATVDKVLYNDRSSITIRGIVDGVDIFNICENFSFYNSSTQTYFASKSGLFVNKTFSNDNLLLKYDDNDFKFNSDGIFINHFESPIGLKNDTIKPLPIRDIFGIPLTLIYYLFSPIK